MDQHISPLPHEFGSLTNTALSGDLGLRDLEPAAGEKILAFWSPEIAISKGKTPQNGFKIAKFSRLRRAQNTQTAFDYQGLWISIWSVLHDPPLGLVRFYSKGGGSCKAILPDSAESFPPPHVLNADSAFDQISQTDSEKIYCKIISCGSEHPMEKNGIEIIPVLVRFLLPILRNYLESSNCSHMQNETIGKMKQAFILETLQRRINILCRHGLTLNRYFDPPQVCFKSVERSKTIKYSHEAFLIVV